MNNTPSPTAPKKKESRKNRNLRIAGTIAQMLAAFMPMLISITSKDEESFFAEDANTVHDLVAEKAWSKLPA